MNIRKKLIEVALPLEAINNACLSENKPGVKKHPRGLHLYKARRPLAAARAVIFAQMVDDPSSWPDLFKDEKAQEMERQRLFRIIEDLVKWENTTNEEVLQKARDEIWRSWRRACAENVDHPQAKELFNREKLPAFHDPFAGGGALPLEAQRLGLEAHASDLNPVAVLINKAMIEIPPKFAGCAPVHPNVSQTKSVWKGAEGLAEDVRYYGQWMRDEAEKRIGHLYPKLKVTAEMVAERPDLTPYLGKDLAVIAWIWVRTVKSPNPAFREVDIPLASTFMLSTKAGKEAYVAPIIENEGYRFTVMVGKPSDQNSATPGTTLGKRAAFRCLMSQSPVTYEYIRSEGVAGRMGAKLMAIVVEGDRGRVYIQPDQVHADTANSEAPPWSPDIALPNNTRDFKTPLYGLNTFASLFTNRQLVALTTFADLMQEVREKVLVDALASGFASNGKRASEGDTSATAYADAIVTYLALANDRMADYNSSIATWKPSGEQVMQTLKRQAIPMTWDFPESNPLGSSAICWHKAIKYTHEALANLVAGSLDGIATSADAATQTLSAAKVVSTDPPYYDNIGYADLADFFYVWLRRALHDIYPKLFATMTVPKLEELVATAHRHGGKRAAEKFFLDGMTLAMVRLCEQSHPAFPVTIYYAFKQSETDADGGQASTGWETFLEAVRRAGFMLTGTWPMQTEGTERILAMGNNALSTSIVLVCRKRDEHAETISRREFLLALEAELPKPVAVLQKGNVAPVDLQQAAIGPGMAIFSRYEQVIDSGGEPLSVRDALAAINQTLDDILTNQDSDVDSDTRWAIVWFEEFGFAEGPFGRADDIARAKNTSVDGIRQAGIGTHGKGKVRLFKPEELPDDWTPESDSRLTVWDTVHHLIKSLEQGEEVAGRLLAKLGSNAETARELAYRLYSISERKKRSADALRYNALVQSWPELVRLAQSPSEAKSEPQTTLQFE